jgi:RsiW-degrading membrane proteinase PrsW (M82 family)
MILKWDSARPEPLSELWAVFRAGMLVVIPVALLEAFIEGFFGGMNLSFNTSILVKSFIVAGLCEEFAKMQIVMRKIYKNPVFDEHMDGIVYSVMASMGFALIENFFYVFQHGIGTGVLRCFTAVPMHAMTTGIMGYYIGLSIFYAKEEERSGLIYKGLLIAVFIHGAYDYLCFTPGMGLLILPWLVAVYTYLKKLMDLAKAHDMETMRIREIESPRVKDDHAAADQFFNTAAPVEKAGHPPGGFETIGNTVFTTYCVKCGTENLETNPLCSKCGEKLS